jgi:glyoxylase-like metal-dependent hydrolase (beta-lactamase superfamily II)
VGYSIYAVKYAERDARSGEHFYGGYPEDRPMPMDYFVWAIVSPEHTLVVDTGFTAEVGARRGRRHLRTPAEALKTVGVDAQSVSLVVISHFHYDHIGTLGDFPAARFVVQEAEMAYWLGRSLSRGEVHRHIELDNLVDMLRLNHAGRLRFVDGSEEILPGVSVHWVGGHTPGIQVVRVETERGPMVLATDASHYYANVAEDRAFITFTDLPGVFRAFDALRRLAGGLDRVVAGHDPLVLQRYPPVSPELAGIAARLA